MRIVPVFLLLLVFSLPLWAAPTINLPAVLVINEDTPGVFDFTPYLSIPTGETATLSCQPATNLSVAITGFTVTITTQVANWNGQETLVFTASSGTGSDTANTDIMVMAVNDTPVLNLPPAGFSFDEDSSFSIDFSDPNNDGDLTDSYLSDVDNPLSQLTLSASQANGMQVTINGFVVSFAPEPDKYGTQNVFFWVSDNQSSQPGVGSCPVTINPLNDPPTCTSNPEIEAGALFVNNIATLNRGQWNDDIDFWGHVNGELPYQFNPTFNYQWQVSEDNSTWFAIAGAASLGYLVRADDDNKWLRCKVTLTDNGYGAPPTQSLQVVSQSVRVGAPRFRFANGAYYNNSTAQVSINEDQTLTGQLTVIDDAGTDSFSWNFLNVTNGSFEFTSSRITQQSQSFSFVPQPNYFGQAGFTVTVTDDQATTSTLNFVVQVQPVNDTPVIASELPDITLTEDDTLRVDFAAYISDPDQDTLQLSTTGTNITSQAFGNQLLFTPAPNFNGTALLQLQLSDGNLTATAPLNVNVTPVDDPPTWALPDTLQIKEDTSRQIDFSSYYNEVDGDTLTITMQANQYINATISQNQVTLQPSIANWNGVTNLVFDLYDTHTTVSDSLELHVLPVPDMPIINLPPTFGFDEDEQVNLNFANYITEGDGQELTLEASATTNLQININGLQVTLTNATPNWNGSENVIFTVTDTDTQQTRFSVADTVAINVTQVNDAPVLSALSPVSFAEDNTYQLNLTPFASDVDGDDLTVSISDNTEIELNGNGLEAELEPSNNWYGTETVTITVSDGTLSASQNLNVTITPVNDPPEFGVLNTVNIDEDSSTEVDFSDKVSDPENNQLSLSVEQNPNISAQVNGLNITFTPVTGFTGTQAVTIVASDGRNRATTSADMNIVVAPVYHAPTITLPNIFTISEDTPQEFDFSDYLSNPLVSISISGSQYLSLQQNNTTVTIIPAQDFNGTQTVTFTVNDGTDTGTDDTDIIITPVNDAPVLENISAPSIMQYSALELTLKATDVDTSHDKLTYSVEFTTDPEGYTLTDSLFSWTPDYTVSGICPIRFFVSDGTDADTLAFNINVSQPSDTTPPQLTPGEYPTEIAVGLQDELMLEIIARDTYPVAEVMFHYKGASASQYSSQQVQSTDSLYTATVTAETFDNAGLQFYFTATDVYDNTSQSQIYTIGNYYINNGLSVPLTKFGNTTNDYRIVSIPMRLDNPRAGDVFADDLGAYNTQWRLMRYVMNDLVEFGDSTTTGGYQFNQLAPGEAFWLLATDSTTVDTGPGRTVADSLYTITLYQGWNQIGNPFLTDMSWTAVKNANPPELSSVLDDQVMLWNGQDWEESTTIPVWQGAFIYCGLTMQLDLTSSTAGSRQFNQPSWQTTLTATNGYTSTTATFGQDYNAQIGKDTYDCLRPPAFADALALYFNRPQSPWPQLKTDVIPADDKTWELQLNAPNNQAITLSWHKDQLPGNDFYISSTQLGRTWNMSQQTSLTLYNSQTLYISRGNQPNNSTNGLKHQLFANAPNPFNPSTQLAFTVGGNTPVTANLKIYNLRGRLVKNLLQQKVEPGYHQVTWNGQDNNHRPAASGIYLYRLQLNNGKTSVYKANGRMMLLK